MNNLKKLIEDIESSPFNLSRREKIEFTLYHWYRTIRAAPKNAARSHRYRKQRIARGWSDKDTWSFDHYLAGVIVGGVTKLRDDGHGYPVNICTTCDHTKWFHDENCDAEAEWNRILTEIIEGFELAQTVSFSTGILQTEEEKQKIENGFDLFKKYYFNLWD